MSRSPPLFVLREVDVPILDALESFPISRYRLNGYDTNTVAKKTTNFLLTSSQSTGVVLNDGKSEAMTCGMVSPVDARKDCQYQDEPWSEATYMITPHAHMLLRYQCSSASKENRTYPPSANANWKKDTATRPGYPKHASMICPDHQLFPLWPSWKETYADVGVSS